MSPGVDYKIHWRENSFDEARCDTKYQKVPNECQMVGGRNSVRQSSNQLLMVKFRLKGHSARLWGEDKNWIYSLLYKYDAFLDYMTVKLNVN